MNYTPVPMTEEQAKIRALEHELNTLRSRHETLGAAYRTACDELVALRKDAERHKARFAAIGVLCEVTTP